MQNKKSDILSRDEFIKVINNIYEMHQYHNKLNKFIFQPDCTEDVFLLLHRIFGKADENEWIEYFVFELECGHKWEEGLVLDENGNDIRLSNPGELYDFLCELM